MKNLSDSTNAHTRIFDIVVVGEVTDMVSSHRQDGPLSQHRDDTHSAQL